VVEGVDSSWLGDDPAVQCYRGLIAEYHRTLDLMSDRGLAALDSMLEDAAAYAAAALRWSEGGVVVDLGSGAGLPGVVVARVCHEQPVLWVERRRRRATFLEIVRSRCGLKNVTVVADDVAQVAAGRLPGRLAVVTAQAVAGWSAMYGLTAHLHGTSVVLVARRGEAWAEEVATFAEHLAAAVDVVEHVPLGRGGTLVVLRAPGGRLCR